MVLGQILKLVFTAASQNHVSHPHMSLKVKWFSPLVLVCIWVCISANRKHPYLIMLFITTASVAVKLMCLAWLDARLKLS